MAKYVFFGQTADGFATGPVSATYATARAMGAGTVVDTTATTLKVGQQISGGNYACFQGFISFDTSAIPATEQVSASLLAVQTSGTLGADVAVMVYARDWGATLVAGSAVAGASLSGLTLAAKVASNGGGNPSGATLMAQMSNAVTASTATRFLLAGYDQGVNQPPVSPANQYCLLQSADTSGTASDPTLTVYTTVRSCLTTVGNGLLQLSDGCWVSLRSDGGVTPVITLYYSTDGVTFTSIATVPTGTSSSTFNVTSLHGHQVLSLCADSSDNLDVVGYRGDDYRMACKAYNKTVGSHAWTAAGLTSVATAGWYGNVGAAIEALWLSTTDKLWVAQVVQQANSVAVNTVNQSVYPLSILSASVARAGSGTLMSSSPPNAFLGLDAPTGAGACIFRVVGSTTYPVVARVPSYGGGVWGVYDTVANETTLSADNAAAGQRNGETKVRAVRVSDTEIDLLFDDSAGAYPGNTGCFALLRESFGPSSLSYGAVADAATGTSTQTQSANSKQAQSLKWDAFYDAVNSKIWVYFIDTTNGQRLARTSFSLLSNAWVGDDVTVNASLAATSSVNLAVRCVPSPYSLNSMLVEVANCTLGGTGVHSIISTVDLLSSPPNAPVLNAVATFDAAVGTTLSWTYSNAIPTDTQTQYQVEINNVTTGATAVNATVASTAQSYALAAGAPMVNEDSYQWRVTTWDLHGVKGATSAWASFATSAKPVVAITAPPSPAYAASSSSYAVVWTYTQAAQVQASYRVLVTVTAGGATAWDSGVVAGTALTATAVGLVSGVGYTVSVVATSAAGVASTAVTQTLAPSFGTPDQPTITAVAVAGGIQIGIVNPTPTGTRPAPTRNELWRNDGSGDGAALLPGYEGDNFGSPGWPYASNVTGTRPAAGYYLVQDDVPVLADGVTVQTVYDMDVVSGKAVSYIARAST
jgi:hypothetical protein